jgi:hypothetical protein
MADNDNPRDPAQLSLGGIVAQPSRCSSNPEGEHDEPRSPPPHRAD